MGSQTEAFGLGASGPGTSLKSALRIWRGRLAWAVGLALAIVVVVVLGRVVLDAASAAARVEELRAANEALRAQIEALVAEKQLVTSPIFVEFAGRGGGYGDPSERAFGLVPGGPPPAPLVAEESAPTAKTSPLAAWLSLLFGPS